MAILLYSVAFSQNLNFMAKSKMVITKEVCNGGVACSLLKLDGGWQATPSITKFLSYYIDLFCRPGNLKILQVGRIFQLETQLLSYDCVIYEHTLF